jgi:hypothetical protein
MDKFMDLEHKKLFRKLRSQLTVSKRKENNLLAVLYMMAGSEKIRDSISHYINWEEGAINFNSLFDENVFDKDMDLLFRLAKELYSEEDNLKISQLGMLNDVDLRLTLLTIYWNKMGLISDNYTNENPTIII